MSVDMAWSRDCCATITNVERYVAGSLHVSDAYWGNRVRGDKRLKLLRYNTTTFFVKSFWRAYLRLGSAIHLQSKEAKKHPGVEFAGICFTS
jgi:hypothetical protein